MTSSTSLVLPPRARKRSGTGLTRIASSGTKCSGENFFSLRYLMQSIAHFSSSTTIASMYLPIATVTAALYRRCDGLQMSKTRPWTPLKRRLRFSSASLDRRSRSDSFCSTFEVHKDASASRTRTSSSSRRDRELSLCCFALPKSALRPFTASRRSESRPLLSCSRSSRSSARAAAVTASRASCSARSRGCRAAVLRLFSSRSFAWICSLSGAVVSPTSALSLLYSASCFFPSESSPVASVSAAFCALCAMAPFNSSSSARREARSFSWASAVPRTFSSVFRAMPSRLSRPFCSSRSRMAGCALASICPCVLTSLRSSSVFRCASLALPLSPSSTALCACTCACSAACNSSQPKRCASALSLTSLSMPSSFCRISWRCNSFRLDCSLAYCSASSFCLRIALRSLVRPLRFWCW
mmetsp:Transcript_47386/g.109943  ORF Transcript_47386/g.109943 Transcript_47386/m.109943 type:complete len:413 (-) Transcript_47386:224-1462(-)